MNLLQIALMIFASYALLYELIKIGMIIGVVAHHGTITLSNSLLVILLVCVLIQTSFVLSLTGVNLS